jgi:hypothetical protein
MFNFIIQNITYSSLPFQIINLNNNYYLKSINVFMDKINYQQIKLKSFIYNLTGTSYIFIDNHKHKHIYILHI